MFNRSYAKLIFIISALLVMTACQPVKHRGWQGSSASGLVVQKGKAVCAKKYVVKSGDTLSQIAVTCKVSQSTIVLLNSLKAPYWLQVGQKLTLPGYSEPKEIHLFSPIQKQNLPKATFKWPLKIKKNFKYVSDASGVTSIILNAQLGDAIYAAEAGRVVYSGKGIKQFGKMVIIKHHNGYLTIYAHNDSLVVHEGDKVKRGQFIGTVGKTGNVSSPQLLLEVRYKGQKINAKGLFN